MSIFYSIWKIYKILIFHNLKRYDIHHKMDEIDKFNQNIYIYIIPNGMEKYMTFLLW